MQPKAKKEPSLSGGIKPGRRITMIIGFLTFAAATNIISAVLLTGQVNEGASWLAAGAVLNLITILAAGLAVGVALADEEPQERS